MSTPETGQALSRIPPTGYGPFWPSLLGRGLVSWRRRRTGSGTAKSALVGGLA